jgi:phenazine biosynthesis protein phzE
MVMREGEDEVMLLEGEASQHDLLEQIPRKTGKTDSGEEEFDTISVLPFSQVKEKGYRVHDGGEKISTIQIQNQTRMSIQDVCAHIPREDLELEGGDELEPTIPLDEYEELIRKVLEDEIGNGEGANFVIPNVYKGKILNISRGIVLSVLRTILETEYGSYMSYVFYDGERYIVGASPEKHLSVKKKQVQMVPISGTIRKNGEPVNRDQLIAFLRDNKEIMELAMVCDEEFKMMSRMCEKGGESIGPCIREMSNVGHSEYMLQGMSDKDIIDLLRRSMFAPTVTGSPMGHAISEIIYKYEQASRGYYASALVMMGRDGDGEDVLDSAITIRTATIGAHDGEISIPAGATLVKDSVPADEVKETQAKAGAMLKCLTNKNGAKPQPSIAKLLEDPEIQKILAERNKLFNKYLMETQEHVDNTRDALKDKKITIINNEDDFVYTLKHMVKSLGATADVVKYSDYEVAGDNSDLVIVGPGPGDPNDMDNPKMAKLSRIVSELKSLGKKFFAECLGHQMLCRELGMELNKKDDSSQGVQASIDYFGERERVGFYNSFAAQYEKIADVDMAYDKESGEVHAMRNSHFASMQFHPDSLLSTNGFKLFGDTMEGLVTDNWNSSE